MKYVVAINDRKYEVEVEKGQATIVETNPAAAAVAAAPPQPDVARTAGAPESIQGEKLLAPMPGVVLHVKAAAGTPVNKNQPLLILEAMKMENEVVSPLEGVVVFIIAKGAHVAAGDVLAIIK